MIFGRKQMKKIDPALALAELRSTIEIAVDEARACGVRSYLLAQALEDAATAVRVKHAMTAPIL
jgi:hypothetical protein